jgi:leucine dehydrogenase
MASLGVMALFDRLQHGGFEQVAWCHDARTGLRALVAIHSTRLGPALGGVRFRPYASEDHALTDVLRLAAGMTAKAAVSGLDLGGGKAVILGDPRTDRTDALVAAFGRAVDGFGGRYVTAEDVGTTERDMDLLRTVTPHVTGTSRASGGSGDPSPATAVGVLAAMRAVVAHRFGDRSLAGRSVVVAGVGKVGAALAGHLAAEGARLTVADVDEAAARAVAARTGATVVDPAVAHRVACDIFSPCALGAVLDARTIPELACAAVAGAANNQLAEEADAERLADTGVLYAPDYVVNAGGIVNIADELTHGTYDEDRAMAAVARIEGTTAAILERASAEGTTTVAAAERLAAARLAAGDGAAPEHAGGTR